MTKRGVMQYMHAVYPEQHQQADLLADTAMSCALSSSHAHSACHSHPWHACTPHTSRGEADTNGAAQGQAEWEEDSLQPVLFVQLLHSCDATTLGGLVPSMLTILEAAAVPHSRWSSPGADLAPAFAMPVLGCSAVPQPLQRSASVNICR